MDVEMPDGTVVQDVPEGTTQADLQARYTAHTAKSAPAAAPAGPQVPLPQGWTPVQNAPIPTGPGYESFLDKHPIGRILNAFGQGMHDGFGEGTIPKETEAELRKAGVWKKDGDTNPFTSPFKTFNEAIMRPAAALLDTVRLPGALISGAGAATGQIMDEIFGSADPGTTHGAGRRDFENMANTVPVVLGMASELGVLSRPSARPVRAGEAAPPVAPVVQLDQFRPQAPGVLDTDKLPGLTIGGRSINYQQARELSRADQLPDDKIIVFDTRKADSIEGIFPDVKSAEAFMAAHPEGDSFDYGTPREIEKWNPTGDETDAYHEQSLRERIGGAMDQMRMEAAAKAAANDALPGPSSTMATSEGIPEPHVLFEDQAETANKAGNINLDHIAASEDVKDVIRKTAADNGGFMEARRGQMSLVETEQLADALGMTSESLNTRKIGQAFNAEQITAARKLLVTSANDVFELSRNVKEGDEASLQAYVQAEAKFKTVQEQVAGLTAEGGRALNAFKINARAVGDAKDFSEVLKGLGDSPEDAAARAAAVRGINSPSGVANFLNSTRKPTFKDQFLEFWINGLLSGPATHTTYAASNALMALWKGGVETPVAGAIGAVRGKIAGTPVDRVFMGETAARLHGFAQGAIEGVPAGWRAIKSGVTEAMPGEEQRLPLVPKIPGVAGQVITVPSRVIAGIHTFGRAVAGRMEANALAYRDAANAGLEGDEFTAHYVQTLANPSDQRMDEISRAASADVMMKQPEGVFGKRLEALSNANLATKMIAPFVRVGMNIVDQGLVQRTPMGLLSSDVRDTLMGKNGAAARDTQIARMAVGSAVGAGIISLAAQGYVTGGGPSDPKEMATWRLTGKQPYSVRVGDFWYPYHRLGAWGQVVGAAADMYEAGHAMEDHDIGTVASLVTNSIAKNMIDESWMRGPADFFQAAMDPDRYGAAYVRGQLTTLIPFSVGMGQVARAIDPDIRNAKTITDAAKAKIPVLSMTVRPRYDIWGQEMKNEGSLGPDVLSAIYESRVNHDPVNQELLGLGVFPSRLEQKIRGVQLSPDQYDEFQKISGRLAKTALDGQIGTDGWNTLPAYVRKDVIENTIRNSRQSAEGYMQMSHPELITQGIQNRINQVRGVAK